MSGTVKVNLHFIWHYFIKILFVCNFGKFNYVQAVVLVTVIIISEWEKK